MWPQIAASTLKGIKAPLPQRCLAPMDDLGSMVSGWCGGKELCTAAGTGHSRLGRKIRLKPVLLPGGLAMTRYGHSSSQMYATTQTRDNGIESVKSNGTSTTVKDLTKS